MSLLPAEPSPERDPGYVYVPDPLGRLGRGSWRRRPEPFGRLAVDDAFDAFRRAFDPDARVEDLFGNFPFRLAGPVGREAENRRSDVARVETFLAKAGYHDVRRTDGPTGYFGAPLEDAVRRFQKDNGLAADGLIDPDGPTLTALKDSVGQAEGTRSPARPDGETREAMMMPRDKFRDPNWWKEGILEGGAGGGVPRGAAVGVRDIIKSLLTPDGDEPTAPDKGPPPAPGDDAAARREALADEFVKQVTGPMHSDRGDPTTQKGNNIVAQECKKVLKEDYPDFFNNVEHVGGATKDGKGQDRLKETYIPNKEGKGDPRIGSSNADLTWQRTDRDPNQEDSGAFTHANTATMGKRGDFTADERRSFAQLVNNVGEDFANILPKLRPGMDEDEYRATARRACQQIFKKWLGEPKGKTQPPSEVPSP